MAEQTREEVPVFELIDDWLLEMDQEDQSTARENATKLQPRLVWDEERGVFWVAFSPASR